MVCYFCVLLSMLVAKWEPTSGYCDAYPVGTPKWAFWEKSGLNYCKTTVSLLFKRVFLVNKKTVFFFWGGVDMDAPYWRG